MDLVSVLNFACFITSTDEQVPQAQATDSSYQIGGEEANRRGGTACKPRGLRNLRFVNIVSVVNQFSYLIGGEDANRRGGQACKPCGLQTLKFASLVSE